MLLFGTSGIRRLVDRDLVHLGLQVGLAVGSLYDQVIVGRDTRTSGSALRHAVMAGLLASGARSSDAGVLPTPTLALAAAHFKVGIMITASHNPPQYNGLKLLNPDGSAFSAGQQNQIEDMIAGLTPAKVLWETMQPGEVYSSAMENHIALIRREFPAGIKIKVVVDSCCGAAYFITPHLLTLLGCEVTAINCHADGFFPHDIEPVEANLGDLIQAVKDSGADLGIAHDGDADRMMAVDDLGRFISGDKLLAIFARAAGNKNIVTTIDASMSIDEMHFKVRRTRVGDPYVSEELKKGGGFGGEPSGAWVFPQISLCPDGIFAAAQIAAVASRGKLSLLVDNLPSYPVIRGNIAGSVSSMDSIKQRMITELQPASIDSIDGLKLNFHDGWLLVRPSGTEPKIRLSAEAKSEAAARRYYEAGSRIIKTFI
jgi:phosphoglucosamine mutase